MKKSLKITLTMLPLVILAAVLFFPPSKEGFKKETQEERSYPLTVASPQISITPPSSVVKSPGLAVNKLMPMEPTKEDSTFEIILAAKFSSAPSLRRSLTILRQLPRDEVARDIHRQFANSTGTGVEREKLLWFARRIIARPTCSCGKTWS
jgi:hypothetical protein